MRLEDFCGAKLLLALFDDEVTEVDVGWVPSGALAFNFSLLL
jgi:hypothetical protein